MFPIRLTPYKPKRLQADEAQAILNAIVNGYPETAERLIHELTEDGIRDLHQLGSIIREGTERELRQREESARRRQTEEARLRRGKLPQ
jgi:hypothetical protein